MWSFNQMIPYWSQNTHFIMLLTTQSHFYHHFSYILQHINPTLLQPCSFPCLHLIYLLLFHDLRPSLHFPFPMQQSLPLYLSLHLSPSKYSVHLLLNCLLFSQHCTILSSPSFHFQMFHYLPTVILMEADIFLSLETLLTSCDIDRNRSIGILERR